MRKREQPPVEKRRGYGRHLAVIAGLSLLLLLATFVSSAVGDGEAEPGPLIAPAVDSIGELNEVLDPVEPAESEPVTDPGAALTMPHTSLGREEAEDLLVSVFPTVTEDPGGIYNGLDIEEFHSDHVAVIAPDDPAEPAGLLTSLLPLRAEMADGTKRPIDLSLASTTQGDLQPANPLVELEIPSTAAGQIELPETDVGVELVSPLGDRSASTIDGGAAFYPNVADDSDFLVVPAATGFETFTQLRTAAAPTTQRFNLNLPAGAVVQATEDGGAVALEEGKPLLIVRPPTALDARGEEVPVSLSIDGESIKLHETPSADAAYPILVDPLWDNYSWKTSNSNAGIYDDWRSYTTPNQSLFTANWIGNLGGTLYSGLALRSYPGSITPGTSANWHYYVPRYFSDYEAIGKRPTSFIRNMKLEQVYYMIEENPGAGQPYIIAGIWDEGKGTFHSSITHDAHEGAMSGATLNFPNSQENTNVRNGGIALTSYNDGAFKRQAYAGGASVEVTDKDLPTWGYALSPAAWTNNSTATAPIDYAVSDSGLGVRYVKVTRPMAAGGSASSWTTFYQCVGSASSPCPANTGPASQAITYDPGAMAQGESTISLVAQDPVGNESASRLVKVRIDHDRPTVGLSGNLTEQATVGTKLAKYTLNYAAADGDDAAAAAMTPVGTAGTGPGQLEHPYGLATDAAGNIWVTDTVNNRLVELDKNGTYIRQISSANGVAFKELRGVTVAPSGNVWVAEKGNNRVMKFSSTGGFISQFTNAALQPFDVAVSEGGTVWVTDPTDEKVFRFKEDGTLLQAIDKSGWYLPAGSQKPYGIDLDEFGNAWIAIQGTNAGLELSPTGGLKWSFGNSGSGPGQLNAPFDIAVASSGNVFVADSGNNRIQEFKPDGTFLRTFGTGPGSANNQLTSPKGIDVVDGNKLLIADFENRRIARWEHADQDPQSGVVKVQVKVDGTTKLTNAPGCVAGKNCSLAGSWTLNADEYTVGTHKVEVFATDGVNFVTEKVLNVETHGDRTAPTVSLAGTITEQAALGQTLPAYKVKVSASDPGPVEERKSGVASVAIKVDGTTVDSTSPGCPAEGCSLTREWTMKPSTCSACFVAGAHLLEVSVSDAAGKIQSVSKEFQIKKDSTAPELTLSGTLAEAPAGWVQDGTRGFTANVTDVGGYGVKQIRFQVDGTLAGASSIQTCELGSCTQSKAFAIDLSTFGGGAHEGVVVAEDLAGNIRKKTWTINIDPLGNITASEVADTLEAAEQTAPDAAGLSPASGVVSNSNVDGAGNPPTLVLKNGQLQSEGAPAPSTVGATASAGFTVESTDVNGAGNVRSTVIAIQPSQVPASAGSPALSSEAAAVISNSAPETDTVLHPIYNGLMTFQDLRDGSAPESYSWKVKLGLNEELKAIDTHHAGVFWPDGTEAMLILAQEAHGAAGESVPTTLTVSQGSIITLTVQHHAGNYVYPIMAGTGWQGGFQTETATVEEPNTHPDGTEELVVAEIVASAPTLDGYGPADSEEASSSSVPDYLGHLSYLICHRVSCDIYNRRQKAFFWYNYTETWYPTDREPVCTNDPGTTYILEGEECAWVGPNHQKWCKRYVIPCQTTHITARNRFEVGQDLGVRKTVPKSVVARIYPSGQVLLYETDQICNPQQSSCLGKFLKEGHG